MRRAMWLVCLLAGACAATVRVPTGELAESRAAVRVAEQAGADGDADAALYLMRARQQIDDGEVMIAQDRYGDARRTLERAGMDARLAASLARAASARADARDAQRQVDELKARVR